MTTQTASLSAINPLIAHDEWSEDTANGVGLILEGCVAAMKVKNA